MTVARNALTYNFPAKLALDTVEVLKRYTSCASVIYQCDTQLFPCVHNAVYCVCSAVAEAELRDDLHEEYLLNMYALCILYHYSIGMV